MMLRNYGLEVKRESRPMAEKRGENCYNVARNLFLFIKDRL